MQEKLQISLVAARVNARLTQKDVAKKLHINKKTIVSWEKGRTAPRCDQLKKLCDLYKIPIDCIFVPYNLTKSEKFKEG
jgi:DNA-binding XRE family transcriptional regulator